MTALPQLFLERLDQIIPSEKKEQVLSSFSFNKPLTIRINTLKTDIAKLKEVLRKLPIKFDEVSWIKEALIFFDITAKQITDLEIYKQGLIYIQSLSSMVPAVVLDPQPGDKVLDLAAAPGSKTTQMATMMDNRGVIIANDVDQNRLFKLKSILFQQGIINTTITRISGQSFWKKYPEYFDKVLLDAPCSMEGRFDMNDPNSFSHWSLKKVKNLSKLQKWLLRSAVSATKVGGTIVYSTCTLSPEENEEVIDWILEKEKGNVKLENIALARFTDWQNGITIWGGKRYSPEIFKTKRIFPSTLMEGFFITKLRKLKSNTP